MKFRKRLYETRKSFRNRGHSDLTSRLAQVRKPISTRFSRGILLEANIHTEKRRSRLPV